MRCCLGSSSCIWIFSGCWLPFRFVQREWRSVGLQVQADSCAIRFRGCWFAWLILALSHIFFRYNVDHNLSTLAGTKGFHRIRIISVLTYKYGKCVTRHSLCTERSRSRSKHWPEVAVRLSYSKTCRKHQLSRNRRWHWVLLWTDSCRIILPHFQQRYNLIWHAGYYLEPELGPRPNWSGFV